MHAPELFFWAKAVHARSGQPRFHLLDQASHANLKKLVEIGTDKGEVLEPFEQRITHILRLFENPPVERQPAQFTIEVSGLALLDSLLLRHETLDNGGNAREGKR